MYQYLRHISPPQPRHGHIKFCPGMVSPLQTEAGAIFGEGLIPENVRALGSGDTAPPPQTHTHTHQNCLSVLHFLFGLLNIMHFLLTNIQYYLEVNATGKALESVTSPTPSFNTERNWGPERGGDLPKIIQLSYWQKRG